MSNLPAIERFQSSTGVRIYRIPCQAFPGFIAYVYLLFDAGPITLVDTGSGFGSCTEEILKGIQSVRDDFGEPVQVSDIRRILLTHGHIDHFGGLAGILERTQAEVGIHHLDRRVITAYEERVIVATKALRAYLEWAGVSESFRPTLMEMYGFSKKHVRSTPIDITLEDGMELDGMRFIHAPGHCPGQVCIALGDTLLAADHILSRTTPHQAPESITAYTGLGHYFEALQRVRNIDGFDMALAGHEEPMPDVYGRIDEIRASHERKLERVIDIIRTAEGPVTVSDISKAMYTGLKGFNILLALEEVGAHVEYLYQRGNLAVTNLDEVEREENPPLRYEVL